MPYRRREIKTEARESLRYSRPRWWKAGLMNVLILDAVSLGVLLLAARVWSHAILPGVILLSVLAQCLRFGFQGYCLGTCRSALTGYWNLFSGFRRVGPVISLALLRWAFCALWSLIPLAVGLAVQLLLFAAGGQAVLEAVNMGFQIRAGAWTLRLWVNPILDVSILLAAVIGMWKTLQYQLAPYLMLDDPLESARSAIRKSRAMMRGRCGSLLVLGLSFLGYLILGVLAVAAGSFLFGAVCLAAAGAASPSGIPGAFAETIGRSVTQALETGDLQGVFTVLAAPYAGMLAGAVGAKGAAEILSAVPCALPPLLLALPVRLRATAYYTCAEAGFYDSVSGKRQEDRPAARQTSAVWGGFE